MVVVVAAVDVVVAVVAVVAVVVGGPFAWLPWAPSSSDSVCEWTTRTFSSTSSAVVELYAIHVFGAPLGENNSRDDDEYGRCDDDDGDGDYELYDDNDDNYGRCDDDDDDDCGQYDDDDLKQQPQ